MHLLVNHMVQSSSARLDSSFAALGCDPTGVLDQLGRANASITDLAQQFHMTLTGMKKHVDVLEQTGLVTTEKIGRVRTCRLGPHRLAQEAAWIDKSCDGMVRRLVEGSVGQSLRFHWVEVEADNYDEAMTVMLNTFGAEVRSAGRRRCMVELRPRPR